MTSIGVVSRSGRSAAHWARACSIRSSSDVCTLIILTCRYLASSGPAPGPGRSQVRRREYADLASAYAALDRWCEDTGRRPAGVSWQVYGDWEEDPAKRRTDVFFLLG